MAEIKNKIEEDILIQDLNIWASLQDYVLSSDWPEYIADQVRLSQLIAKLTKEISQHLLEAQHTP